MSDDKSKADALVKSREEDLDLDSDNREGEDVPVKERTKGNMLWIPETQHI